jgi:hypothetical protein
MQIVIQRYPTGIFPEQRLRSRAKPASSASPAKPSEERH